MTSVNSMEYALSISMKERLDMAVSQNNKSLQHHKTTVRKWFGSALVAFPSVSLNNADQDRGKGRISEHHYTNMTSHRHASYLAIIS